MFWELFNDILTNIKGKDYKFNPKAIMVNGNGANYCVIQNVLGVNFVTSKVVIVRCTRKMMSIGYPSELGQVTEIFSKAFVMGCIL